MAKAKKPARSTATKTSVVKKTAGAKPKAIKTATKAAKITATKAVAKTTGAKPRAGELPTPDVHQEARNVRGLLRDVNTVVRQNPIGSLELLCKAWRMQKSVRLAELAELVEMRVPEYPEAELAQGIEDRRAPALRPAVRSIVKATAGTAADHLTKVIWIDPRLSWLLLELLAKPAWRSLPAVNCWSRCLSAIVEISDPRIIEPLEELGERYTGVIPTSVGVMVQKRIRHAVAALRKAKPWAALDAECNALCDQIAAQLGPEVAAQQAKRAHQRVAYERHAEFLAAIFGAPDDDGPRTVYADWLSEIGDPRGELINLQLARARGVSDEASRARELELLDPTHAEKWLGAIAPVVFDNDQVFSRGFTAYVRLWKNKAALPNVADEPAWGTVETIATSDLGGAGQHGEKALVEIVCGPRTCALRALVNFPAEILSTLAERGGLARIERVEALDLLTPGLPHHVGRWLATATRPRALSFETRNWGADDSNLTWLVELPGFERLERVLLTRTQTTAASIARLEATRLPCVHLHTTNDVHIELSRSASSTRFDRARVWRVVPPSWLEGSRATLDGDDTFGDLAPWIPERAVTIDTRELFVPGTIAARRPVRCPPSEALIARIRERAASVEVEAGWVDRLPEMIWNY